MLLYMSFTHKSKCARSPFQINKANEVNDNFIVKFKPTAATRFRASDEFTICIDDDYSKLLNASLIHANVARDFSAGKWRRRRRFN